MSTTKPGDSLIATQDEQRRRMVFAGKRIHAAVNRFILASTLHERQQARRWAEAWAMLGGLKKFNWRGLITEEVAISHVAGGNSIARRREVSPMTELRDPLSNIEMQVRLFQEEIDRHEQGPLWLAIIGLLAIFAMGAGISALALAN